MKDLFVVDFGVERTFDMLAVSYPKMAWLFAGPLGKSLRALAKMFLAKSLEKGVLQIDLTIDAVVSAHEIKEYRARAQKLYNKALLRVYTDDEKQAIRLEYAAMLRRLGGLRKRSQNTRH